MIRLLLASASPARLATLRAAGIDPVVQVSGVDEDAVVRHHTADGQSATAAETALMLARAKAEDVAATAPAAELVVGCDSVLEFDGQTWGKPVDAAEAIARWHRMRGGTGVLHTGHHVVDLRSPAHDGVGALASVTVRFAAVTDDEIDAYVASGEPLSVAGAFTLDGLGGAYVRGIEGDPHAVVGLSLPLLRELLAGRGVVWHSLWHRAT